MGGPGKINRLKNDEHASS